MSDIEVRQAAQAWVASFAPLVMESGPVLTDVVVRERLARIEELRTEGPALKERLHALDDPDDATLRWTVEKALDQLDFIEVELRRRLAKLAPGDREGRVDLEALRDRLSERAALQEVGLSEGSPTVLRLEVGPPSFSTARGWWALAAFNGLASAVMAFGGVAVLGDDLWPASLVLFALSALGIYGASRSVQWGYKAASSESIELEGIQLKLIRTYKSMESVEVYTLTADCAAAVEPIPVTTTFFVGGMIGPFIGGAASNQPFSPGKAVVTITTHGGGAVRFGGSTTDAQREAVVEKINAYLKAYGAG